jgi:hypothetical protein
VLRCAQECQIAIVGTRDVSGSIQNQRVHVALAVRYSAQKLRRSLGKLQTHYALSLFSNEVPAMKTARPSLHDLSDLKETHHESFRLPTNKDIKIWRYMNVAKYLSMLHSHALFFPRANLLGDPFEGSWTKTMVAERERVKENKSTDPNLAAYKDYPDTYFDDMSRLFKMLIESYLISCWHMNEFESAAMWKLYSNSDEAISVQSTYRRLRVCVPKTVFIGEVTYIDYETDAFSMANGFNFIMHKRLSFAHERELRAIFWESREGHDNEQYRAKIEPSGLAIEVDLPMLIERVYVSPTAASWFARVVEAMTAKCGFSFPVSQSALAEAPLY